MERMGPGGRRSAWWEMSMPRTELLLSSTLVFSRPRDIIYINPWFCFLVLESWRRHLPCLCVWGWKPQEQSASPRTSAGGSEVGAQCLGHVVVLAGSPGSLGRTGESEKGRGSPDSGLWCGRWECDRAAGGALVDLGGPWWGCLQSPRKGHEVVGGCWLVNLGKLGLSCLGAPGGRV